MQIVRNATNLNMVGAWNPAILQPSWLARHVFRRPEGEQVPVTMAFATIPGAPPKWTIEGITFVPSLDNLLIEPASLEEAALSSAEDKAVTILEMLPHTPIAAFGENFQFMDNQPTPDLLRVFELNDDAGERIEAENELSSTSITTSLQLSDCLLNLSRQFSDGRLTLKFNFHYETTTAADAAQKLRGSFSRNYGLVTRFLDSYHVVLDAQEVAHA
jgi:hypothetical protein